MGSAITCCALTQARADVPAPTSASPADAAGLEFFESKIRPLLVDNCLRCHNSEKKPKGNLKLDARDTLLAGGDSGAAIVAGDPEKSLLVKAVRYVDKELQMPPKEKLADDQIHALEAWVKMGAPFPEGMLKPSAGSTPPPTEIHAMPLDEAKSFWSFKRPVDAALPETTTKDWAKSPIDAFILAKLEARKIAPSPQADRRTLIRRATFDLTGLPPTMADVLAFESDNATNAWERVIDRLLASPQYGERWGRHWLDVARYADTKGYVFQEERRYAFSYTYRDYVIRAFNEDPPYDQFLTQQLAADKLDLGADKRPLAALGYLTLGRRFLNAQPDIIDDRIDVTARGMLGLTVACARCHDHKYDAIPTADYYSLYGVFASSHEPSELPIIEPPGAPEAQSAERDTFNKELAAKRAALDAEREKRVEAHRAKAREPKNLALYLLTSHEADGLPQDQLNDRTIKRGLVPLVVSRWRNYLTTAAQKNDAIFRPWRELSAVSDAVPTLYQLNAYKKALEYAREGSGVNSKVAAALLARPPRSIEELARRYSQVLSRRDRAEPFANDADDEGLRVVLRGENVPSNLSSEELAQVLTVEDRNVIAGLKQQIDALIATHPGSPPRAMALEETAPVNPHIFKRGNQHNLGDEVPRQFLAVLSPDGRTPFKDGGRLELAKLIASKDNPLTARVLVNRVWMYHFGAGLVRTPSDFGVRGEKPTHPELLDYLALRFLNEDGWSIKKLHKRIMLSAAYQQASVNVPDNAHVDPENRLVWRQNPERLDFEAMRDSLLAVAGHLDPKMGGRSVDILAQPFIPRRTVYAFIDRQNLPGMFRTFDFASPDATNAQRPNTSVPQQALFMMNSPFAIEQARKVAARADIVSESDVSRRVAALYRATLAREPRPDELALGVRFIETETADDADRAKAGNLSIWQYGYGEVDEAAQTVKTFTPMPNFDGTTWSGGPKIPDPKTAWVSLLANGGHTGRDQQHAAIRRWTAPRDCTVSIKGAIAHNAKDGDGVRARIVTPHDGIVAQWTVARRDASTDVSGILVKQGETLDFVVDAGPANDDNSDSFTWKIVITKQSTPDAVAGDDTGSSWDSADEFAGPTKQPEPLTAWEKYAQVLLESNEFAFVD